MEIIGLRIEKFINENSEDFEKFEDEKHILLGILNDKDKSKIEITLWTEVGMCGSGWCSATWGHMEIEKVENFRGYTYKPINRLIVNDLDLSDTEVENKVFSVSYDDNDGWYPGGYCTVDMNLFKPTIRIKEKRPVWLFVGESNIGKSYLGSKLNNMEVYETDSNNTLPKEICADVIVKGNKYDFSIEDIESNIFGEYELIIVKFDKN